MSSEKTKTKTNLSASLNTIPHILHTLLYDSWVYFLFYDFQVSMSLNYDNMR